MLEKHYTELTILCKQCGSAMCEETHTYSIQIHRVKANRLYTEVNARPYHIDETGPAEP